MRFAELHPIASKDRLAAPIPTSKADPAYPPDLIHDGVQGTVVLYAVIRSDGTITDIRVLNSVNRRLDDNAMSALRRWHFEPGSKDGHPVDVEAVVQVPFRSQSLKY